MKRLCVFLCLICALAMVISSCSPACSHVDENGNGFCDKCGEYFDSANPEDEENKSGDSHVRHTIVNGVCTECGLPESTAGLEFEPTEDGKGYTCTGIGSCTETDIVLGVYKGLTVTGIDEDAFSGCDSLKSVTVGSGIKSIGDGAFSDCYKLVEIINKSSLNITTGSSKNGYIGYHAIEVHTGESKIVNVDDYLFYTYDGVNYLLGYAGSDTELVLPENYNGENYGIYNKAFYNCDSLKNVTIGSGVTSIGEEAFYGCDNLKFNEYDNALYLGNESNPYHALIQAKSKDITACEINLNTKLVCPLAFNECTNLKSVTIPDGVTSIGYSAFKDCDRLTSVTIPDSVTYIGDDAFYKCDRLTSVTIPDSVTYIGDDAFYKCDNLSYVHITDIAAWCNISFTGSTANPMCHSAILYLNGEPVTELIIPDSITSIADYTFYGCASLTSVIIPASVTEIGSSAFMDCTSLASVTIPDSITSIGNNAFYRCVRLTSVTIPGSVTYIGDYAFKGCTSLTSVTIPDSVTSIGYEAFANCASLTSVTVGNGVTSIGNYAFFLCKSLTNVTIPDSVTSIGEKAFMDCASLTSVTIPDSVTSIGSSAFYGCTSLASITIPDSVKSIGFYAFYGCANLTIYCEAEFEGVIWNPDWNGSNRPVVWGYKES